MPPRRSDCGLKGGSAMSQNQQKISLIIDGVICTALSGDTVLAAARKNGIQIPALCHHPLVKSYGACGVCLVEEENSPKLLRACAAEARDGMVLYTKSKRAEEGRRLALELMFSDHCGDCIPPCMKACPAHTDCQSYAGLIAEGRYAEAAEVIREHIPLPASIGRVCPHPCETACRRQLVEEPVSIAALKRFVGDKLLNQETAFRAPGPDGKSCAVIGAGPSGLSAAYYLAEKGYRVEIFEAMPLAGGMLRYGIPGYRLPKPVLDEEIKRIESMGVAIHRSTKIGRDVDFETLRRDFDAVYVAVGAWKSSSLRCDGEDAQGVLGGIDFLRAVAEGKEPDIGNDVIVVGGGNTAMDACRTAVRLGAEHVVVVYRRGREEMPAEDAEISEAMEEGVEFRFLAAPVAVETMNGKVTGFKVQRMELGEPDASGRRKPVPVEGDITVLKADTVIAAIGQKVVTDGIPCELQKWGTIAADKHTYETNLRGVFAGGDCINDGPGIAVSAIAHGKEAAEMIDAYLKGDTLPGPALFGGAERSMTAEDFLDIETDSRRGYVVRPAEERKADFNEITSAFTEEDAKAEASRCLECGCNDYYRCGLIHYSAVRDLQPGRITPSEKPKRGIISFANLYYNRDKCILCGLCVRICDEVAEKGILGLINRGFDTQIRPAFLSEDEKNTCFTCGKCAEVCPTGAMMNHPHRWDNLK